MLAAPVSGALRERHEHHQGSASLTRRLGATLQTRGTTPAAEGTASVGGGGPAAAASGAAVVDAVAAPAAASGPAGTATAPFRASAASAGCAAACRGKRSSAL